jgi:UDP-2-acetamido-2-deoxy-ribo-hexuluronate aminotransferase
MEFIDLALQQRRIRKKIEYSIRTVLDHGEYIMGPEVKELEDRLADYVGVKHAVGCASGTDALLLALMAYNVGAGDAVFTTPFTFIATAEVISLLGAIPVFVDINPLTFNMSSEGLEKAITAVKNNDPSMYPLPKAMIHEPSTINSRGVIAVDLFGLPVDYERINHIAREHGMFVIEDGAQSLGADYHGKKACSLADIGCASFFPAKPLGCYGDGGMCFTDDGDLADLICSLRIHGKGSHKYDNVKIGINGRLDTLQAAVLLAKFDIFPEEVALRRKVARRYTELIKSNGCPIIAPESPTGCKSVWAQYSVLANSEENRSVLQAKLKNAGIPTAIYYPKPLHLQTAFLPLGYQEGDFPVSEECCRRIFSLPMHPYLTAHQQERVIQSLI